MSSVLQAFLLTVLGAALLARDPILIVLTGVFAFLAYGISALGEYDHVRRNWATYRCNPQYTPFAKYYGYDLQETLTACIQEEVKKHAGGVMIPVYEGVAKVVDTVDGVYDKAAAVASGVEGLLGGFKNFVVNFASSFRLVGVRVRMSLIRVKDIFARVYGTFIAFAYAAISALTFGENLVCNPLVTFVAGIAGADVCCFAPSTPVWMADGSQRAIGDIRIGDELRGAGRVGSVYRFSGVEVPMVRIRGIHVSTNHSLRGPNGEWVPAGQHPDAVGAEEIPELVCLATDESLIPIPDASGSTLWFTDYEESTEPAVIAEAQRAAEEALNPDRISGPAMEEYSLGLDPACVIRVAAGQRKRLQEIRLGDILANGQRVIGVIDEVCTSGIRTPGGSVVSAAQLIWWESRWRRAGTLGWTRAEGPRILRHLMVDSIGSFILEDAGGIRLIVRDYAEAPAAQTPYDMALGIRKLEPPSRPPTPFPNLV